MAGIIDALKQQLLSYKAIKQLLIVNLVVFAIQHIGIGLFDNYFFKSLFVVSPSVDQWVKAPFAFITTAFAHNWIGGGRPGFSHLLFNMLIMLWTGSLFARYAGNRRIWPLYILSSLMGLSFFVLAVLFAPQFLSGATFAPFGANAGVLGMLCAAAVMAPKEKMRLILIGNVELRWIALGFVLLSIFGNAIFGGSVFILGGVVMGGLFGYMLVKGKDLATPFFVISDFMRGIFGKGTGAKVHRMKPPKAPKSKFTWRTAKSNTSKKPGESAPGRDKKMAKTTAQAQIDAILDKISVSGYDSLSKDEKERLFRHGQEH